MISTLAGRAGAALFCVSAAALSAQTKTDTVVRNATPPIHKGVGDLAKELSIGIADGDKHYVIGGIGDIAVAQNGTMYIYDRSVPTILMYDSRGKYMKSIGRRGSGPGEFQSGAAIAVARNGNLLMYDPGNARINLYSSNGDVVTHWPTRASGTGTAAGKGLLKTDAKGNTYVWLPFQDAWLRFGADGAFKDTLRAQVPKEELLTWSERGQFMNRVVPFAGTNISRISPEGYVVTGFSDRIAINLHMRPNEIVSIRRPIQRKRVTAHERDSARADITAEFRKSSPQWSWNAAEIPDSKPAYHSFNVAEDGRIWVELERGPQKSDPDGGDNFVMTSTKPGGRGRADAPGGFGSACPEAGWKLFDVYEPSGRYLGQVKTPERNELVIMRGDFVWSSTCNEDEVPVMVRYKINWR